MSNYENTGPGGVGKRYGALEVGGIVGTEGGCSATKALTFEFGPAEVDAVNAQTFTPPSDYAALGGRCFVEVQEAFAAGTIDVHYKGVTVLTAPVSLTVAGRIDLGLVAAVTLEAGEDVTVVIAGVTGDAGYAKTLMEVSYI